MDRLPTPIFLGFPDGSAGEESACNGVDLVSVPGLRISPGEGNGYPLQYSRLENFMGRGPGGLQSLRSQRVRKCATNTLSPLNRLQTCVSQMLN